MRNLLNGDFNENEILIIPPGAVVNATYDDDIIKWEK